MIVKLIIWAVTKLFNSKKRNLIEPCIKQLYWRMVQDRVAPHSKEITHWYRKIAQDEFVLKHEIVKVKKGNRRYDLLFVEDSSGKRKIQISRHLVALHDNLMEVTL